MAPATFLLPVPPTRQSPQPLLARVADLAGLSEPTEPELNLTTPVPGDADIWQEVSAAALAFWHALASEQRVTSSFRRIARANAASVEAYRNAARRLP